MPDQIYVELLDEGIRVWRPVASRHIAPNTVYFQKTADELIIESTTFRKREASGIGDPLGILPASQCKRFGQQKRPPIDFQVLD